MARRVTIWILGFVLAVIAAEATARLVMESSEPSIRWYDAAAELKIDELDHREPSAVVFAGTSSAWQGFVPSIWSDITGESGYNAGLAGGTPEVMRRWLPEETTPRAEPATVVWGLSSLDLAPEYGEQQAEAYDDAPETATGWLAAVDRAASSVSELIRERTVLRSPDELWGDGKTDRVDDRDEASAITGTDGERLDFTEDVSSERGAIISARLRRFHPDPDDLQRIADTVADLEAEGVEVVLVQLPMPQRFIERHPGGAADYAQTGLALSALADELDVRFLDLSTGYDDDDFVDYTHLDQPGAARFTTEAAEAYLGDRNDAGEAPSGPFEDGG